MPDQPTLLVEYHLKTRSSHRSSKRRLLLILLSAAWLVGDGEAVAQTPLGPLPADPLRGLLELPDDEVPMAYVPGALDRAARLQVRLKGIYHRLAVWMKLEGDFRVLVLSPREWGALDTPQPYGFPARVDLSTAAVAAWGTPESVEVWRGLLGSLPKPAGFSARGSREEVASLLLADALVELELCRTMVYSQRLAGGPDGAWLIDLLGHIVCNAADHLMEEPNPVPLLPLLTTAASAQGAGGIPDLAAYGDDLDTGRWMAFQAHFARGAEQVWQAGGKQSVRKLMRLRRRKGSPLVFEDLLAHFPVLESWRGSGT